MKFRAFILAAVLGMILGGCSTAKFAQSSEVDDVYFTSADQPDVSASNTASSTAYQDDYETNRQEKYSPDPQNRNYQGYYDDDYYFSRRMRRFGNPGMGFGYYDPYFAYDPYFCINTPYWDPFYANTSWWYDPFFYNGPAFTWTSSWGYGGGYMSYGWGSYYGWNVGWNNSWRAYYYTGWGNPYSPWGWNPYGAGFNNGYCLGYNAGLRTGMSGFNNYYRETNNTVYRQRTSRGSYATSNQIRSNRVYNVSEDRTRSAVFDNKRSDLRPYQYDPGKVPQNYVRSNAVAPSSSGSLNSRSSGNTASPVNSGSNATLQSTNPSYQSRPGSTVPSNNRSNPYNSGSNSGTLNGVDNKTPSGSITPSGSSTRSGTRDEIQKSPTRSNTNVGEQKNYSPSRSRSYQRSSSPSRSSTPSRSNNSYQRSNSSPSRSYQNSSPSRSGGSYNHSSGSSRSSGSSSSGGRRR